MSSAASGSHRLSAGVSAFRVGRAEDSVPASGEHRVGATIELAVGDLTAETTDAIVSPSNRGLSGGGLVDLAVRRAAGPELIAACQAEIRKRRGGMLSPGQVVLTPGYRLPAAHVIHCVPPIYEADRSTAQKNLAACFTAALEMARVEGLGSISFPAVATGVYGYPVGEAARVSTATVVEQLAAFAAPRLVRFVLYGPAMLDEYVGAIRDLLGARVRADERSASAE